MARYVALLRGINVGGKNLIRMAELAACFEGGGLRNVATYIQSGNVLFESTATAPRLVRQLEALLTDTFGYPASVVLRTQEQLRQTVGGAPEGFGAEPARYRYDVLFLKPPLEGRAAAEAVPKRDGVDRLWPGPGVVYASRLASRAPESRLGRLAALPVYQQMTIRNWNTTTKLLAMMDARTHVRERALR